MRQEKNEATTIFSPLELLLGRILDRLSGPWRPLYTLASWALYAALTLALTGTLLVSANYLVILPVLISALCFGLPGGALAGIAGLPANLCMFYLAKASQAAPASLLIAEISGVILGSSLGFLADYHRKLGLERERRKGTEDNLRKALQDKEILMRELHHRVKNNLNLVKSLISMQSRRSEDMAFKKAAEELTGRILAISMVHEQLYRKAELASVAIDDYLRTLSQSIVASAASPSTAPELSLNILPREFSMDTALPLGLALNEALINALKHARPKENRLRIEVGFTLRNDLFVLEVRDNGQELCTAQCPGSMPECIEQQGGLGLFLVNLLAGQLGGSARYEREGGCTVFRLGFPA